MENHADPYSCGHTPVDEYGYYRYSYTVKGE